MTERNGASAVDHPFIIQGRRHARDLLATAERIGRATGKSDRAAMISTSLELVVSAAAVDGETTQDIVDGLASALEWALSRLPAGIRTGVLQEVVANVVSRMQLRAAGDLAETETKGSA